MICNRYLPSFNFPRIYEYQIDDVTEEDENESGQSRETESLLGPLSSTPSPTTVSVSIEQEIDNTPQYENI